MAPPSSTAQDDSRRDRSGICNRSWQLRSNNGVTVRHRPGKTLGGRRAAPSTDPVRRNGWKAQPCWPHSVEVCLRRPLRRGVTQTQEGWGLQSRYRQRPYGRCLYKVRSRSQGKARRPRHFWNRVTGDNTIRTRRLRGHMGPITSRPRYFLHRGRTRRPFHIPISRVHRLARPWTLGAAQWDAALPPWGWGHPRVYLYARGRPTANCPGGTNYH